MYINPVFFEKYISLLQRLCDRHYDVLFPMDAQTRVSLADDLCDLAPLIRFLEYRMGEDCL